MVALKLATALLVAGVFSVVPPTLVVVSKPVTDTFLTWVMAPPALSVTPPLTVTPSVVVVVGALAATDTVVKLPIIKLSASR